MAESFSDVKAKIEAKKTALLGEVDSILSGSKPEPVSADKIEPVADDRIEDGGKTDKHLKDYFDSMRDFKKPEAVVAIEEKTKTATPEGIPLKGEPKEELRKEIEILEKEIAELERQQLEIAKIEDEENLEKISEEIFQKRKILTGKKDELENLELGGAELFEKAQGIEKQEKFEEKNKREELIPQALKELEDARKDYAEIDYKKRTGYKRVYRILGSLFKSKEERSLENDQDLAYYQAIYENKLMDYQNLLLDKARAEGASNTELGKLVKFFALEKGVNLADAHTQVKLENHEGRFSSYIKENSRELVQKYKKLPLKTKIGIAVAFGLVGFGASLVGGAAVGAAGGVMYARRAFTGMVTGTSFSMWLENKGNKKRENMAEKEAEMFEAELGDGNLEEKLRLAQEKINALNKNSDEALEKFKNKNLLHLSLGVAVGTLLGSGLAYEWGGNIFHWLRGETGGLSGGGTGGSAGYDPKHPQHFKGAMPPSDHVDRPHVGGSLKEFPGNGKNILEVANGSSLEGTLIKHYESLGLSKEEAGAKAHQASLRFAEKLNLEKGPYSLIHPGAHIVMEGGEIKEITDDPNLGWLSEHAKTPEVSGAPSEAEAVAESAPSEEVKPVSATETVQDNSVRLTDVKSPYPEVKIEDFRLDDATSEDIRQLDLKIDEVSHELRQLDDQIPAAEESTKGVNAYTNETEELARREEYLNQLLDRKQFLEKAKEDFLFNRDVSYIKSIRKYLSGGMAEKWMAIKDTSAESVINDKASAMHKFYERLVNPNNPETGSLKRIANPVKGETVNDWVIRIVKAARKLGIKRI